MLSVLKVKNKDSETIFIHPVFYVMPLIENKFNAFNVNTNVKIEC